MILDKIVNLINTTRRIDIGVKSRKREYVYLRQLYCYAALKNFRGKYTLQEIADKVNYPHDMVLYSARHFEDTVINIKEYMYLYQTVQKLIDNNFDSKYETFSEMEAFYQKQNELIHDEYNDYKRKVANNFNEDFFHLLSNINDAEMKELITTRIKPFVKLCKSRRKVTARPEGTILGKYGK